MNIFESEKIRNVVLMGHGGSGKTTLIEAMAYITGITNRQGKVTDGNTISDFDKEETKRLFSISTTVVPILWKDLKINFIDTPGYFDFVGEVEEAVSVADGAVIVINGKSGVEVGSQKAWDMCEDAALPRMIFVTDMDDDNADFSQIIDDLKDMYGSKIVPFHMPIRENEKFAGIADVVKMKGIKFAAGGNEECDIPADLADDMETNREALMEAVAETSEEFMDRYFGGDEFTDEEIADAVCQLVADGSIVPVFAGAGISGQGVDILLDAAGSYISAPSGLKVSGKNGEEEFDGDYKNDAPLSVKVWKTLVDPFIGKYSYVKVCSGVLHADSILYNTNKESDEKIGKLFVMRGKEALEVSELESGDIGAIQKLAVTSTGDTLATKAVPVIYEAAQISKPYTYMAYRAKNKGEEDKVANGLSKLMEEDLTLKTVNDTENRQSLLYGIGEQQLDVVVSKLASRYKVDIELTKPRVAYRETIRGKVKVQGKHKKQSGGHGQYGDVVIEFEPSGDLDRPYVFEEKIVGGVVPKNYFPAVEKGIQESVLKGPLAGYPVVGLKATLVFGSYHPVDSSEIAFKTATILAVKKAFAEPDSKPVLLEPIASLKVKVPDKFTGDIMGDLNKRRGRVLGMNPDHRGNQVIEADIPMSELMGYSTDLRAMTGGIGNFEYEFARYEQAPSEVQAKEIAARAEE